MKTAWTKAQVADFIEWHESVIAKYPQAVIDELRNARTAWLGGVRVKP